MVWEVSVDEFSLLATLLSYIRTKKIIKISNVDYVIIQFAYSKKKDIHIQINQMVHTLTLKKSLNKTTTKRWMSYRKQKTTSIHLPCTIRIILATKHYVPASLQHKMYVVTIFCMFAFGFVYLVFALFVIFFLRLLLFDYMCFIRQFFYVFLAAVAFFFYTSVRFVSTNGESINIFHKHHERATYKFQLCGLFDLFLLIKCV